MTRNTYSVLENGVWRQSRKGESRHIMPKGTCRQSNKTEPWYFRKERGSKLGEGFKVLDREARDTNAYSVHENGVWRQGRKGEAAHTMMLKGTCCRSIRTEPWYR